MKKIVKAALAVMLVLAMTVTAFAAPSVSRPERHFRRSEGSCY